jgi:hypothetical protein
MPQAAAPFLDSTIWMKMVAVLTLERMRRLHNVNASYAIFVAGNSVRRRLPPGRSHPSATCARRSPASPVARSD